MKYPVLVKEIKRVVCLMTSVCFISTVLVVMFTYMYISTYLCGCVHVWLLGLLL